MFKKTYYFNFTGIHFIGGEIEKNLISRGTRLEIPKTSKCKPER